MKLIFFFRTSEIFYGQVHFGFLLAPGQVENFTTPLVSCKEDQITRGQTLMAEIEVTFISGLKKI